MKQEEIFALYDATISAEASGDYKTASSFYKQINNYYKKISV